MGLLSGKPRSLESTYRTSQNLTFRDILFCDFYFQVRIRQEVSFYGQISPPLAKNDAAAANGRGSNPIRHQGRLHLTLSDSLVMEHFFQLDLTDKLADHEVNCVKRHCRLCSALSVTLPTEQLAPVAVEQKQKMSFASLKV